MAPLRWNKSAFSALVVLMALVYVRVAVLDRRRSAWVVFLAAFAVLALTQVLDLKINLPLVLLVFALAFLVLEVARGQLRRPGNLTLEASRMLAFGATALVAFYADPPQPLKAKATSLEETVSLAWATEEEPGEPTGTEEGQSCYLALALLVLTTVKS